MNTIETEDDTTELISISTKRSDLVIEQASYTMEQANDSIEI
jgi:hypothetical protein